MFCPSHRGWLFVISLWLLSLQLGLAQPLTGESFAPSQVSAQLVESHNQLVETRVRLRNSSSESQVAWDGLHPEEIERFASQSLKILSRNPGLSELSDLTLDWQERQAALKSTSEKLNSLDSQRAADQRDLDKLSEAWRAIEDNRELASALRQPVEALRQEIVQLRQQEGEARDRIVLSLTELARAQLRADQMLGLIQEARDSRVEHVLVRDGVPVWKIDWSSPAHWEFLSEVNALFSADKRDLADFFERNQAPIGMHCLILILLTAAIAWAHRRVTPWSTQEPALAGALSAFSAPLSTSVLISACLIPWLYPRPPALVHLGLASLTLLPAVIVLRQLVPVRLYPFLNVLVILFSLDLLRTLCALHPLAVRLLLWWELLIACSFLLWAQARAKKAGSTRIHFVCLSINGLLTVAFLANLLGYQGLSLWLADGITHSAYLAVFLIAGVEVVSGLTLLTLRLAPLALLASIRENRNHFRRGIFWAVQALASLIWLVLTLDALDILWPISDALHTVLKAHLTLGSIQFHLGGLLGALLVLWISSKVSRFSKSVLELDVYPHLGLDPGVDYTITTVVRYTILLVGTLMALAAVGVDTNKLTVVAGALSVGIGFGLQNIVNNFVSGLILLFERPVRVGDTIQVNSQVGVLQQVGLRAAILKTGGGSEVIVPNGDLLSTQVTNLSVSAPATQRNVVLNLNLGVLAQPRETLDLLLATTRQTPGVLKDPEPRVLCTAVTENSIAIQVQLWIPLTQDDSTIRSELLLSLHEALRSSTTVESKEG